MKRKRFTASDGKLVLVLEVAEEGGYVVTSPLDPAMITQADTLEEAFEMAADAFKCLREAYRVRETPARTRLPLPSTWGESRHLDQ
jgi:predicted RNase H-like HicB family nuclease